MDETFNLYLQDQPTYLKLLPLPLEWDKKWLRRIWIWRGDCGYAIMHGVVVCKASKDKQRQKKNLKVQQSPAKTSAMSGQAKTDQAPFAHSSFLRWILFIFKY